MLMKNQLNEILSLADNYYNNCVAFIKNAVVKKLPNGKYQVQSHTGKNLGTYTSKSQAEKRLKQVEYFKHLDKNDLNDQETKPIDLSDIDGFSYSAIVRKLKKEATEEQVIDFIKIYKSYFDKAILNKIQKPDLVALKKTIQDFSKSYPIKIDMSMIKNASVSELGDPRLVGKYLSDIVRFTLTRISLEKRPIAIQRLKQKIYSLNENELSMKKLPASSSMGQSITFIKHVLFQHDARYIREVLNNIVRNL